MPAIFRFDLSGLAVFQYALYGGAEGGHFDWHKDYGRDPADPDQEPRKLTVSLQLSEASDYEGCDLQLRAGHQIDTAPTGARHPDRLPRQCAASGDADPREATRRALVAWAVGPEFR